jgi:hypothetical protein
VLNSGGGDMFDHSWRTKMRTFLRSLCVASGLCVALSATLAVAEETVVLGEDDTLTSGIPGTGTLTNEQIEEWLANPANHEPLKVTHFRSA